MANDLKEGKTESMSLLDEMKRENIRLRRDVDKLTEQLNASDAVRYLALDELDHLKKQRVPPDVTEELINALCDACAFAANQVLNCPSGAALSAIGRWRFAIDRVRHRYIVRGTGDEMVAKQPLEKAAQ